MLQENRILKRKDTDEFVKFKSNCTMRSSRDEKTVQVLKSYSEGDKVLILKKFMTPKLFNRATNPPLPQH